MLEVPTQDMCVWFPPSHWVTSGLSNCIRLRTIQHQFYPKHPLLSSTEPSSQCPRESLQHTPWYTPLCRVSPNPFVTSSWQSGSVLHRGTPQVHCHSQWQTLPEGFNFLFSLFAEWLCRSTYPGTFEGKAHICLQANSSWGQLPAPISAAMDTLHKTIWLSRSVSWIRESRVCWDREGGKPALLPPGELNSL